MKIYLISYFCWAMLFGGLVTSCGRTPPTTEHDGGGGDSDTLLGGMGGTAGADCLPSDVFVGSDGCYRPSASCCHDIHEADLSGHCAEAFGPTYSAAYLCSILPGFFGGGLTDYHACAAIETSNIDCSWGLSTVLCCEPM